VADVDVLLVGGGVASASCAEELRERGFSGSVLLVGRELDPPYERPPCSKGFLRGEVDRASTWLHPEDWWAAQDIELRTRTSVLKLDTEAHVARLSDKSEVSYGQALVATGANVRRLPVDGAQFEGIHYLRALGNAEAIRHDVEHASDAVVVGGSYLGTELAASLREMGLRVTVLMQEDVTLERAYGRVAGEWFQALLESRDVRVEGGETLGWFDGGGPASRVSAVVTESGRRFDAQIVVVAAGAVPDVMLAKQSGLALGSLGGVRCDAGLRTSAPGVFAAGDMAEWDSPLHGGFARVEHFEVAAAQGRTAARNMLGDDVAHLEVPYFWSDIGDWATSEYVGVAAPGEWDAEALRGSPDDASFSVWLLRDGRVVGVMAVGRGDDLDAGRALIASRAEVSAEQIADVGTDLAALAG
jgi:3-phenylpropionate/trans-cinnamate dioxygenase ferredoxin reductase subunit